LAGRKKRLPLQPQRKNREVLKNETAVETATRRQVQVLSWQQD